MTDQTRAELSAPDRLRVPLLIVLASLAAASPVATDLYLPGFPAMQASLGADASGVQLTLTTFLVGMAFGQLVVGPLSDQHGRLRPLLISVVVTLVAGVVCALAPNLAVLVVARLVQGFAGAGGMVIGRAVIADLLEGRAAAKAFTLMLTVGGVAPVAAPFVGSLLVGPIGWRGTLWVVVGFTAALLVGVALVVAETHPPEARRTGRGAVITGVREVLATRAFRAPAAVFALAFGVIMAYVASSPFVYQEIVGLSEIEYGVAFGINSVGLIGAGWLAARLIDRIAPVAMIRGALWIQLAAVAGFVALALVDAPSWTLPVPIFIAITANGAVMGNTAALAMSTVRPVAGSGSAVLGFAQFAFGGLVSPLVGLGGSQSALVPAIVMACASASAFVVSRGLREPEPAGPVGSTGPDDPGQADSISSSTSTATS